MCQQKTPPSAPTAAGAVIQRCSLACDGELSGGVIAIDGVEIGQLLFVAAVIVLQRT